MKFFLAITCLVVAVSADLESADFKAFATGTRGFAGDIYREQALKSDGKNFMASPISADIIMALANAGAEGETSEQIVHALHLPNSDEKINEAIKELLPLLKGNDDYTLATANKMYVKKNFGIKDDYKTIATTVFGAEIENIDFADATTAVDEINKWVEDRTENKIKDLIKSSDISEDTRLILINALYFNADWETQFKKDATQQLTFHLNDNNPIPVSTMTTTSVFQYFDCGITNVTMLKMPYKGGDYVMTILLPHEKEGLTRVENILPQIGEASKEYKDVVVDVQIPKFKVETTIEMKDMFAKLDVIAAFDPANADFSGITTDDTDKLYIDKVVQKTFIKCDEKGTEAAAATAVEMNVFRAILPVVPEKTFHADHPFIFVISHAKTHIDLFLGRVTHPETE